MRRLKSGEKSLTKSEVNELKPILGDVFNQVPQRLKSTHVAYIQYVY